MKNIYCVMIVLLSLQTGIVCSQNPADIGPSSYEVEMIPANPEVESLGKFGETPVNKYNGTANIHVPIYEIDHDGLRIPLSLNYNTSGIRVNQDASWVGLGWNLSENIVITRDINGYDDINSSDLDGENVGWIYTEDYYKPEPPYNHLNQLTASELQFLHTRNTSNNPHDLEPDVFSVSLPGGTYKFYLGKLEDGQSHIVASVLNENNVKVIYNVQNKTFEVTDMEGFRYMFTQKEFSTGYSSWDASPGNSDETLALQGIPTWHTNQTRQMIKAWKISRIISPLGGELNFSYQPGFFLSFPHFSEKISFPIQQHMTQLRFESNTIPTPSVSASLTAFNVLYLKKIDGDFGSVVFNLSERLDLFSKEAKAKYAEEPMWNIQISPNTYSAKKVSDITIRDFRNNIVEKADFFYGYFNDNKRNDILKEKFIRLKLDSVKIQDKVYKFEYDHPDNLPPKDTKSTDFWGFYNGINNTVRVPSYNRFFLAHNRTSTPKREYEQFYKGIGANRKSDITYGKYGILKKIIYPTGGYTMFDYEGNSVTLKGISYSADYFSDGFFRDSNINSSQAYNFRYQYLKLAEDPEYTLYEKNTCQLDIEAPAPNGNEFEITDTALCTGQDYNVRVEATISCNVGCGQGISPSGRAVWIENTETGEEIPLFSYSSFNDNGSKDYERELNLPPGKYRLRSTPWSVHTPFLVVAMATASALVWKNASEQEIPYEEFEVGGARLQKITNYDNDNKITDIRTYSYDKEFENGGMFSSGKLMDDLIFTSRGGGLFDYAPEYYSVDGGNRGIVHSDNMLRGNLSASGSHIGYNQVTELQINSSGENNGKVVDRYINKPNDYIMRYVGSTPMFTSSSGSGAYGNVDNWETVLSHYLVGYGDVYILGALPVSHEHMNGSLREKSIFDSGGNIKKHVLNNFEENRGGGYTVYTMYPIMFWTGRYFPVANYSENVDFNRVRLDQIRQLKSTVTTDYFPGHAATDTVHYFYEGLRHRELTKEIRKNSKGHELINKMYYPQDLLSEPFMEDLASLNRLKPVIKRESLARKQEGSTGELINSVQTSYDNDTSSNNLILPKEVKIAKGNRGREQRLVYEKYNDRGKLIQYRKTDDIRVVLIWGYNEQYPIAKIEDIASYTSIPQGLISAAKNASNTGTVATLSAALNDLREALPDARVTTYVYNPLIGITTVTDPRGIKTSYSYDDFNRLEFIRDDTSQLLEEYKYHYKN